jgi:uncharacterized protein (DUF433 family)
MDVTCTVLDTGAIVRAREAGASYAELTARFECRPKMIRRILKAAGVPSMPGRRRA